MEIETDSLMVVHFIKDGCSFCHLLFNQISDIKDMLLLEDNLIPDLFMFSGKPIKWLIASRNMV